jgi:N,N'-diacetyllegionaminate synthase
MVHKLKIRNKILSENSPVFITAEIGVTCNYDMKLTKELIDVAQEAGADAVKLIFWFPDEIMSDKTISYSYNTLKGPVTENMYEMLMQLTFTFEQWQEIKAYADKKNIILFSTVNSPSGIEYAEKLGLEAYKLSSWDYNYLPLFKEIALKGKPMILDTGPVNTLEAMKVMQIMKEARNNQSLMVHCFHTGDHSEMNMKALPYMEKTFDSLVGYSSANQDSETDIMAVTLGAVYLEKRLTISRSLSGHHQILCMEPDEFKDYVKLMRNVQKAIGAETMNPSDNDLLERRKWFRHLVVKKDVPKGTILTADMLEGKRPENGISPEHIDFFIGRELKRDLTTNESLSWSDV